MSQSQLKNAVNIVNVDGITARLEKCSDEVRKALESGLRDCAGELMGRAIRLCPAVTGELRSRSFKTDVMQDDKQSVVYVGWEQHGAKTGSVNGKTAGVLYSVPVHERTYAKHNNGQAKFLETAVKGFQTEFLKSMQKYAEEATK